jgi:hypothetical protein
MSSSGVRLERTTAELRGLRSSIVKTGKYPLGSHFKVEPTRAWGPDDKLYRFQIPINVLVDMDFDGYILITDLAQREIIDNEMDHLRDISYAFSLTFERVTQAVNRVVGDYENGRKALEVLVQELQSDAPQLIPENPSDLPSWKTRLCTVANALISQTEKRDTNQGSQPAYHIPQCFAATTDGWDLYLTPVSQNIHSKPEAIVLLKGIPVVFDFATWKKSASQ